MQRGNPAVGARPELTNVVRIEWQRVEPEQKVRRLAAVEPQLRRVHLGHLVVHAQPADSRRTRPARDDQVEIGRPSVEQELQSRGGILVVDDMPVVEHHGEGLSLLGDVVDQLGEYVAWSVLGRLFENVNEFAGQRRVHPTDGLDEVADEPGDVVVVTVEAEPRHRDSVVAQHAQPLHGERRLAEAGRTVKQGQATRAPFP